MRTPEPRSVIGKDIAGEDPDPTMLAGWAVGAAGGEEPAAEVLGGRAGGGAGGKAGCVGSDAVACTSPAMLVSAALNTCASSGCAWARVGPALKGDATETRPAASSLELLTSKCEPGPGPRGTPVCGASAGCSDNCCTPAPLRHVVKAAAAKAAHTAVEFIGRGPPEAVQ